MRLHDLKPSPGSTKDRKRLGRGTGTGQGTTAGKGTKGEKARSGGLKAGFRGMSSRNARMPKRRGFNNRFKVYYQVVNVAQLARFEPGTTVDAGTLFEGGLISDVQKPVKILGNGELDRAINLVNLKLSGAARQKIEAAGGSVTEEMTAEDALTPETELTVVEPATGEAVGEVVVDAVSDEPAGE